MQPSIKLLLVEDDEDDYIIARDLLKEINTAQYELDWVSDYEAASELIGRRAHDLYLVDYRLGSHSGMDLLKQAVASNCPAPIILMTGLGDHLIDMEAMKAGAADYLVKGQITSALLERSISHSLQRKETERKLRESEAQLRQAQKMESMGTLAGGIAHDFNNILAIIAGYSSRLQSPGLTPAQLSQCASAIHQAVERGAGLVRQILTFARKTEVKAERVQINTLLQELAKMLNQTFPKTICLQLELDPALKPLVADVNQLHQTFLNLCVNARDAMGAGGTLTIKTEMVPGYQLSRRFPEATQSDYALVSVRDSGCGMDEATQSRIFEPFFTTKIKDGGTGLGLATVYGIVKSHNGFIEVVSAPGQGATFRVYLPALSESLPASAKTFSPDQEDVGGKETLLFVEDEELLRDLMKSLLEEKGYHVLAAPDGEEAVAIFARFKTQIRLVITDMGLPRMDGLEVFLRIRQTDPQAKVLLASGYLDPELKSRFLKSGALDFLPKPYVPSQLFRAIRRSLDDKCEPILPGLEIT